MTLKIFCLNRVFSVSLLLLLVLSLVENVMPKTMASQSDKLVKQAVLLIRVSTETADKWTFPIKVAERMNISYTIRNANLQNIDTSLLYDGENGKFSLIFISNTAMTTYLDDNEKSILDSYEENFGVTEALLGPIASDFASRYGVSSMGSAQRFTKLKWANNGLTNFMNTSMYVTTLSSSTTVYAYGGNATQTNPVIWSYTSGNKIRISSSIGSLSPSTGDTFAYWGTFWLASKLSSANKTLKLYWAIDIDDVMYKYSDSGVYGAPPVSNLYFNGSDVQYAVDNLLTPMGFNPTLAIMYSDNSKLNMTTEYPALYSVLTTQKDKFDFTPHYHFFSGKTYQQALDVMRDDRNAISRWGFLQTLYYMVPGGYSYTDITAPALADSPLWYVAQIFSSSSNTHPYINNPGDFDSWSSSLFRVPRCQWVPYNARNSSQVLVQSGFTDWDKYWRDRLDLAFGFTTWSPTKYIGGYRIECSHMHNWVYGRQNSNAPMVTLIKNVTGINILPIVPVRSWAIAETLYFIRNFKFNATYNINQNTLQYTIVKNNLNARNRITLNLQGNARPVDFHPLILKYDQNSTIVTLNYQSVITLKLGEKETTNPYITNYETSLLTTSSFDGNKLAFEISTPSGATSTTKVYVGNKGEPTQVYTTNGTLTWNYNASTGILTLNVFHNGSADIIVDWRILGDVNGDGKVDASDLTELSKAYGSTSASLEWNSNCDFNRDNIISVLDLYPLGKNYGKTKP